MCISKRGGVAWITRRAHMTRMFFYDSSRLRNPQISSSNLLPATFFLYWVGAFPTNHAVCF